MSSIVFTPRKSNKTEAQARNNMDRVLRASNNFNTYYIDDEDGNMARGNETKNPPTTPAAPKNKQPVARKRNPPTPKSTGSTSSQESPSQRKSDRIAAGTKRTAKAMEAEEAANAESSPAKKRNTGKLASFRTDKKVEPAPISKRTGRFTPIKSEIKPAKKIEKRPAESDETEPTIQSRPTKRAKKTHGTSGLTNAQITSDTLEMSIEAAAETDQDDAFEPDDTPTTPTPTKGKRKTTAKSKGKEAVRPPASTGAADQDGSPGSSNERPADATLDAPWKCANGNCNTGQTWHDRKTHGRKVVSDYFGHNKKETNLIDEQVWHYSCRKCYQREKYKIDNQCKKEESTQPLCEWKLKGIEKQVKRIELWRPFAKFKVQLNKKAKDRRTLYSQEYVNTNDPAAAELAATIAAPKNKKGDDLPPPDAHVFPMKKMQEFERTFCSEVEYRDFKYIANVIAWIRTEVNAKRIICLPPFELLINKQAFDDSEPYVDANDNYNQWTKYLAHLATSQDVDDEPQATETESNIAGPSGTRGTSEESEVYIKTEPGVASPSDAASEAEDAGEGDAGGDSYENGGIDPDYDFSFSGGYDYRKADTAAALELFRRCG